MKTAKFAYFLFRYMDQKGKRGAAPQATLHIFIDALSLYIANIPVHVVSHKN